MMKVLSSLSPEDLSLIMLKYQENYSDDELVSHFNLTLDEIKQKEIEILSLLKNDDGVKTDSSQPNQEDIEEKECEITQNEVQVEANKTTEKATESEQEETVKEQKKPQGNPHTKHKREERAQSIKKQASGKVEFYGLQRPKREGEESAPVNRPQKRKN